MKRRTFLTAAGLAGLAGTGACSSGIKRSESTGSTGTLKLGYVTPQTGALAPFGEADTYVVGAVKEWFAKNPLRVGGQDLTVEVLVKDAQSDSKRAGTVASDLILSDKVDLMLVSSTPDITNPVADQCEANGVPCISTVAPWQPWFLGRGGAVGGKSFTWTYHFFWGLEDVEAVYQDMWAAAGAGKKAGGLFPNDPDGNAWGDPKTGFPPAVATNGYSIVDPGRFAVGTQDYSAQIARFKQGGADILLGVVVPPDFTNFWKQAAQQGYRPRIATIAKALLFPSTIEALGDLGQNLGTEVWWSPTHPFTSSLTGQTAAQLAEAFTASTKKQWTQPIGFVHALFEVAAKAVATAGSTDRQAVANALKSLKLDTVVGSLDWTAGPVPNVAKTPLVGGQWRKGTTYPYDLVVVSNPLKTAVPVAGQVQPL
ncbi:ABC transporter substrate-binding protein [Paractinoplanes toevensis]|nr:ABC transporter substrate-binding protein [Actinoplanes toevensis]